MSHQKAAIEPLSVSMAQAATMIGVSRSQMYELDARGLISSVRVGGRRLVLVSSLKRLIGEAA